MKDKIFKIKIADLGISQLYINKKKLEDVIEWFETSKIDEYEPLPVHDFGNGIYTLTDGHTRAYIMFKNCIQDINVRLDIDEMITCDLGQRLYKADIEWCEKYNMHSVCDFENKIISSEHYAVLWLERCKRLYNLLSKDFLYNDLSIKFPDLLLYGANADLSEFYFDDCKGKFYLLKNEFFQEDNAVNRIVTQMNHMSYIK